MCDCECRSTYEYRSVTERARGYVGGRLNGRHEWFSINVIEGLEKDGKHE